MDGEGRGKIHIKPKGLGSVRSSSINYKELEEIKREIKNIKKQLGRILNIAEHEESILEKYKDKIMTLKLVDGSEEKGNLKEITKFQIVLSQNKTEVHIYKSSVLKYYF